MRCGRASRRPCRNDAARPHDPAARCRRVELTDAWLDWVLGPLRVSRSVVVPPAELRWRFSRSSGPGGQSVNTTDSRVELSYDVAASPTLPPLARARLLERLAGRLVDGTLTVVAEEHRSQLRNREAAHARLAALLTDALAPPPPPRRSSAPSRRARARRVEAKRRRGAAKQLRRRPGPD